MIVVLEICCLLFKSLLSLFSVLVSKSVSADSVVLLVPALCFASFKRHSPANILLQVDRLNDDKRKKINTAYCFHL